MECPACAETSPDGATWCEACGQDLNAEPLPACESCGEREVTDEGYCGVCGHKQPEERDHMEFGSDGLIAVTNKGKRHRHNEDAVAVGHALDSHGNVTASALVVCDGVSSTPGSAEASEAAANAALSALVEGLSDPAFASQTDAPSEGAAISGATESDGAPTVTVEGETTPKEDPADGDTGTPSAAGGAGSASQEATAIQRLIETATRAAQAEAAAAPEIESNHPGSSGGPPSSTFVTTVVEADEHGVDVNVGWLGDSRAYWLGEEPLLLTTDHEVEGSLTRWIGADSPNPTPDLASFRFKGLGYLVACSDGLWRYAPTAQELKDLVHRLVDQGAAGTALGAQLIDFANDNGGHDNISAAVWTNHPQPAQAADVANTGHETPAEGNQEESASSADDSADSGSADSDGTEDDSTETDSADSDSTEIDDTDDASGQ